MPKHVRPDPRTLYERWTGWWGDNPPYHHPVFVLTHHPHPPIEIHLVIVPILLGSGGRLFDHLEGGPAGYECVEFVGSPSVTHVRFARTEPRA